ncbi:Prefoldin beta-like protein [Meredithblackwellia eburnea MCA 4105]
MDEAGFRKVISQLQAQYGEARQQLVVASQQLAAKERERKVNSLTLREIEALPRGGKAPSCYKGVGRMFMQESRNNIENTLKSKEKEIADQIAVLGKKTKYLETEMNTAEGSLRDLLKSGAE